MAGRSFAGVLLVAIGVVLLVINLTGVGGVAVVLLGGIAFLATYVATRSYGFLVPGGILTGFGGALVLQDLGVVTDVGLLGLGAGFLLIPLVQLVMRAERAQGWWWPLIPGAILASLGIVEHVQGSAAGLVLPGVLIVLGLVFLLSATRGRPVVVDPAATPPEAEPGPGPEPQDPLGPEAR